MFVLTHGDGLSFAKSDTLTWQQVLIASLDDIKKRSALRHWLLCNQGMLQCSECGKGGDIRNPCNLLKCKRYNLPAKWPSDVFFILFRL
ncbi:MAG: hypothetical protein CMF25_02690 [Kangiellaceae bacterium]|nr:hypothetical protein [Kangiellaceae bacterium]